MTVQAANSTSHRAGMVAVAVVCLMPACGRKMDTNELTMGELAKRIELYQVDQGQTPGTLEDVFGDMPPYRDSWGNEFAYVVPGPDGRPYELISYGSDGKPGGSGLAADLRWSEIHDRFDGADRIGEEEVR